MQNTFFKLGKGMQTHRSKQLILKTPKYTTRIKRLILIGLFSALVVFYFKSSGAWPGFLMVGSLACLLILNEFLHTRYTRIGLSWSLLCLVGIMYLNFVLPHLVHSVSVFWFLLSTLVGFALILLPWKLSGRNRWFLLPPAGVAVILTVAYFAGIVPPVPLVVKQHMVCKQFNRTAGWWCMEPEPSLGASLGFSKPEIYHTPQEKIHYLSSIFAPSHVEAELEHRWFYHDTTTGWQPFEVIPFKMVGGRDEGWRLHSNKASVKPGLWRVETALRGGAVVGRTEFIIPALPEPDGVVYKRRELL